MNGASLVRANAIQIPLADDSVDLIVTSPPYFSLRQYLDDGEHLEGQLGAEPTPREFLEALWAVARECARVLKPSGSIFWNLGDKYAGSGGHNNSNLAKAARDAPTQGPVASRRQSPDRYNQAADVRDKSLMGLPWLFANGCTGALAALGGPDPGLNLVLRAEIVWDKPNGLPESVRDRVRRSHEQWFHLTRCEHYFASTDEIREQHAPQSVERSLRNRFAEDRSQDGIGNPNTVNPGDSCNAAGKLPGSVWRIPGEPLVVPDWLDIKHFAAFPQEWPRRFILGWCPPDGVVLDCFSGTGTVAGVARQLGRYGVGVDLSADYLRLARWRVFQSGHFRKSVDRTDGERQGTLL